MSKIAIIAGEGRLAPAIAEHLPDAPVFALEGFPPPIPASTFRLERLVPFLDHLADLGVENVVFAGAVRRPALDPASFDPRTAQLVPRILTAMQSGDDAALRTVLDIFEEFGISVSGIDEIMPSLIPPEGIVSGDPSAADQTDAARGAEIVAALGPLDLGQGCVVAQGLCLAVETLPGTAAMLDFVARHQGLRPNPNGALGVFYKAPKPDQDRRIDLPTIGPDTVDQVVAAGLAGIAWQAGSVILLDRDETARRARDAGVFLWSRSG
ncbi:LpxI family protein [Paracoccus tegillarcae]|uniref:DUF1009 domain-containing protein n=1 Tax=Paracoccus tegillarcae TaxID=1529068 RepID=A0A2K9EKD5_9RHOB|nr:UDP-2,3-diacylglucosamine diphosphatase LpxI [Paracoccus tegillarcae]AUH34869.1 DUF1009 domain-containing protein [Paracoccus tegillarcae]